MAFLEIRPEELLPPSGAGKRSLEAHYRDVRQRINPVVLTPVKLNWEIPKNIRSHKVQVAFKRSLVQSYENCRLFLAGKGVMIDGQDEKKIIFLDDIVRVVCRAYGVTREDLMGHRRPMYLIRARKIGMWLTKALTKLSISDISRRFGGRDHTTGIHNIRSIEKMRAENTDFAAELDALKAVLRSRPAPRIVNDNGAGE